MRARPLSPHLSVYRWRYTMALSILHRLTGLLLSASLLLLVYWLAALAAGAARYAQVLQQLQHPLVKLLFAGVIASFVFHFLNGIRHLCFDAGVGLERAQAQRSAWALLILAGVITAALLAVLFVRAGAA
jgi:succinate dehydrogenase / fumarate reductase, cytochrome b subunit